MPLDEQGRSQLDGIVQKMVASEEPDHAIHFVVNDFKSKYETPMASATASSPDHQMHDIATEQGSGPIGDLAAGFGKGVQREVGAMRQALQAALTEAAGTVGKAGGVWARDEGIRPCCESGQVGV